MRETCVLQAGIQRGNPIASRTQLQFSPGKSRDHLSGLQGLDLDEVAGADGVWDVIVLADTPKPKPSSQGVHCENVIEYHCKIKDDPLSGFTVQPIIFHSDQLFLTWWSKDPSVPYGT